MANGDKRAAKPRRRSDTATRELLKVLIGRFDNIEGRLGAIEANQTTMTNEISRGARATAELNARCTERLGLKATCPLDDDDLDDDPAELEPLRCASTCPHGDRCTLEDGHPGGHNHRGCDCNEPNLDAAG